MPCISLHKSKEGFDELALDLSPLRTPDSFRRIAEQVAETETGAAIEPLVQRAPEDGAAAAERELVLDFRREDDSLRIAFLTEPIYRLPMYTLSWREERSAAKERAGRLALRFGAGELGFKGPQDSTSRGPPQVKAGKSRQSGGYGIG